MLILDESEQYTEKQDNMGQAEPGHNDDKVVAEEVQDEVQEKQDNDDDEEAEPDEDEE